MKLFFYGFLAFANTLFALVNLWKFVFQVHPSGLVALGLMLSLAHLIYFAPALLTEYRQRGEAA